MKTKTQQDTIVAVPPLPSPATPLDIELAAKLRADIAKFNEGTPARSELTASDIETLDGFLSDAEAFRRDGGAVARDAAATSQLGDAGVMERHTDAGTRIVSALLRFVALNKGRRDETVAGLDVSTPAIESASFRAQLQREGSNVITAIDSYCDVRRSFIDADDQREKMNAATLAALRAEPVTGGVLQAAEWLLKFGRQVDGTVIIPNAINGLMAAAGAIAAVNREASPELRLQLPEGISQNALAEMLRREFEASNPRVQAN